MTPEIRPATVEDAEAAAWCHIQCWHEAYDGLAPADLLARRTANVEQRIERWADAVRAGRTRWLAINPDPAAPVADRVIGIAGAGSGRDEDDPAPVELEMIYARAAWWGTGLGRRLLEVAVGKDPAYLWVFEDNQRALGFYDRHGFVADGKRLHDEFFDLWEIRLVRT
ncbi:GNAT family N-acetyltransferase [Kribbella antibiotica]|uniref:GNAT family N-acetyltransferase n=1 Tax=Kribbella antibiotica TaxID=190195 RepID=A0A4R4ZTZ7_9ACTN|nr:GNAT family N-acetyltransferase [Kribbella antibiotica]TDD60522.1 GNAT family N-acetyltransferase [Kribbella antibiotica]